MAQETRRREVIEEEGFRETLAPPVAAPRAYERDTYYGLANVVYFLFGVLEVVLGLRFLFLLFGANPGNGFVNFIYTLSHPFMVPFYGVFGQIDAASTTIASTLDLSTIVAMIVYAVIGWAIIRLIAAANNRPADRL